MFNGHNGHNDDRAGETVQRGYWRDRTVLVTGAGGFVASWISRALVDAGASVIGVVRDSPGERMLLLQGIRDRVTVVHGSIVDYPLVERAINEYGVDTCFHLAAQALVGVANRSPLSTFESNIKGTWNILEACRLSSTVKSVVVASSDKAYGLQTELPYREESPLQGRFPYDASKVCADVLAACYATTFDLPVAVTRCANIYGGGDLNWSRLIPGTIRSVLAGEPPIIRSDGTMVRDYLYVADAVEAYLSVARQVSSPNVRGCAFNFGSQRPASVLQVVDLIGRVAGTSIEPRVLGQATGEIDRQYLDSALAEQVLGWRPGASLEQGLAHTLEWYAAHLHTDFDAARRMQELTCKS